VNHDLVADVVGRLQALRSETVETTAALRVHEQQVEHCQARLENPQAVKDYLAFFIQLFERAGGELHRVAAELDGGVPGGPAASIRHLVASMEAEERRAVEFRDRWINKPLSDEQTRSLLNQISMDTRDQLVSYRTLLAAAQDLDDREGPENSGGVGGTTGSGAPKAPIFGRRALFSRLLGR
jgi:hypothetical protein